MSAAELILTSFVAIIVFGPTRLPMLARHLSQAIKKMNELKKLASEFWQQQLNEAQLIDNLQKAKTADQSYCLKQTPNESNKANQTDSQVDGNKVPYGSLNNSLDDNPQQAKKSAQE